MYLKVAPQVIFYDFACSLEEYCFNRESGYFHNTKFFHDIFHSFSHSCSPAYNSKFLSGVRGVNTSICEQYNSYLQCIKASPKHMSQVNFMFFAQYMIHIWNKSKKKSFQKKLLFATATIWVIFAITWICLTTNIVYIFLEENFVARHFTTTLNN